jgi:hypothetical protein
MIRMSVVPSCRVERQDDVRLPASDLRDKTIHNAALRWKVGKPPIGVLP